MDGEARDTGGGWQSLFFGGYSEFQKPEPDFILGLEFIDFPNLSQILLSGSLTSHHQNSFPSRWPGWYDVSCYMCIWIAHAHICTRCVWYQTYNPLDALHNLPTDGRTHTTQTCVQRDGSTRHCWLLWQGVCVRVCVCGEDVQGNHPYIWQQLKCIHVPHSQSKFMVPFSGKSFFLNPFYGLRSHCWDCEMQQSSFVTCVMSVN